MRGKHQLLAGLAGACLMLALPVICQAATITVSSLADPGAPGICALRDAITAANTKAAVNGCAAGRGNDTIGFSVSGTITLEATLPVIVNKLAIQGPSANPPAVAVSGALNYQVMVVNGGATLDIAYITIENGFLLGGNGGGVANHGTLIVTNSTFSNVLIPQSLGGDIYNDGTLTVTNSTFSGDAGDGGCIFNASELTVTNTTFTTCGANFGFGGGISNGGGTLTVTNSTFADNGGDEGGGIFNGGKLTVTNSTFGGNRADIGAGIYNDDEGTVTVTNSTFSANSASLLGGGIDNSGTLSVTNSTLSGNSATFGGGGIDNGGSLGGSELPSPVDVKGTIFAASTGGNCATGQFAGEITDNGFNLDDDGSCDFASGTTSDADIALDPTGLQKNGGPTETIALEPGSVAINAIPVASCQYVNVNPCTNPPTPSASGPLVCDQRGEPRPGAGESACAIGAFEPQTLTEFEQFNTGLIVFPNQFAAGGGFTLAANAPTFNPPTQAVTMTISSAGFGPLAVSIPPGHFTLVKGQYKYSGTIAGINYGVTIGAPVDAVYQFTFAAFGVDVTGISNPVSVTLQVGSNIGTDDDVAAAIL